MPMEKQSTPHRKPSWLKRYLPNLEGISKVESIISAFNLHTVCQSARCPNKEECFSKGTATFLIMGDICTRNCAFCAVNSGHPLPLDKDEPFKIAEVAKKLRLKHVVITSVTRDDLSDGGTGHFVKIIEEVRRQLPEVTIETLIPDFGGDTKLIEKVCKARPDVLNHNLETISRLYSTVRPKADYKRSLRLIKIASKYKVLTKSGIMVGLGETLQETKELMKDLVIFGCKILTIGQYLQPIKDNLKVNKYYTPGEFDKLSKIGKEIGLEKVFSTPFTRSSYKAEEVTSERLKVSCKM
ncbi:MAG: lipoyl synthase [bacterium]|nr:lipoyl synthase [bacterium]